MTGKFEITAWDCYNWHNLKQQNRRLKPGDLLTLGPSESGKTTIIDAIQQVVTGDMDVQMNSAADPMRGKTELKEKGRSLRTIVLRIEEDGTMLGSPGVNIAYFIVELTDMTTKERVVLALGAKAHSEGQSVDRWWLIGRGTSIDDVAFTREADGKTYALDKDGLRRENPKCDIYDIVRYRIELVDLLFPHLKDQPDAEKRAHLRKWATYLNIAKSYGRLHSADPNELIRDALPEPRIEAFEVAKRAIGEVNEIRRRVSEAEERLQWMRHADTHLKQARDRQTRLHANEYARLKLRHESLANEIADLEEQRETQLGIVREKQGEEAKLRVQLGHAEERVRALDDPEAKALMDQIRRLHDEIQDLTQRIGPMNERLGRLRDEASALQQRISARSIEYDQARTATFASVVAQAKLLKPPLRDAVEGLAEAVNTGEQEDIHSSQTKVETEQLRSVRSLVQLEEAQRALATGEASKLVELRATERRLIELTDVAPLAQATDRASELGGKAKLAYQGIEIRPGQEQDAVLLQEFLGPRVLSAILPSAPEGFDHVKRHVHATNPELLVVETSQLQEYGLLSGILQCVDVENSDPTAVRYLASIVGDVALLEKGATRGTHERAIWKDGSVYDGKAWHIEPGAELKFLGEKARKRTRDQDLQRTRDAIAAAEKAANAYTNKALAHERERILVENTIKQVASTIQKANFEKYRTDLLVWQRQLEAKAENVSALADELEGLATKLEAAQGAHAQLLEDAHKTGADESVAKQAAAEAAVAQIRKDMEAALGDASKAEGQANLLQSLVDARVGKRDQARDDATAARETLLVFAGFTTREAEEYLTREEIHELDEKGLRSSTVTLSGHLEKHKAEVRKARDELIRKNEDVEFVEETYVFRETRSGRLLEERMKVLTEETATDRRRQIERIRSIQHQQVIEPIGEMLKEDLVNLEQTTSDINEHFKRTPFNGRKYILTKTLKPDAPKLLVKLIGDYTRTNTEPLKDELMRLFTEEERTAQELQRYFDYRTWFNFELQRSKPMKGDEFATAASAGGSGGAQTAPHYILSYAMLTMFYRTSQARFWCILLDEAFTRVDVANRFILYEMAKELGFSVIAANTEFDGHSSLRKTANILFVKKDPKTFETHVREFSQEFHEGGQTRQQTLP